MATATGMPARRWLVIAGVHQGKFCTERGRDGFVLILDAEDGDRIHAHVDACRRVRFMAGDKVVKRDDDTPWKVVEVNGEVVRIERPFGERDTVIAGDLELVTA